MEDTRARWERAYKQALDYDTWGQVEEATENYQRLLYATSAEHQENVLNLPHNRRDNIGRLAAALKLRIEELQLGAKHGIGLEGMKKLAPFMKQLIVAEVAFPLSNVTADPAAAGPRVTDVSETSPERGSGDAAGGSSDYYSNDAAGTLRPPPTKVRAGDTTLTIFVQQWGFKEVDFQHARVIVSVRDDKGNKLEAVQETPFAGRQTMNYVVFDQVVYVQTPLNRLPPGAAIFFEFTHYKVAKKKRSCKAYCYMEMDEVRDGPMTLEVYKKPAVYTRKRKPALLTVKPFYLHLEIKTQKRV